MQANTLLIVRVREIHVCIRVLGLHDILPQTVWLETVEVYSHGSGGQESEIELLTGWLLLEGMWENPRSG